MGLKFSLFDILILILLPFATNTYTIMQKITTGLQMVKYPWALKSKLNTFSVIKLSESTELFGMKSKFCTFYVYLLFLSVMQGSPVDDGRIIVCHFPKL